MTAATHNIKITYIAAQYRVRAELRRADALAQAHPPADIMERAKRKLENEVEAGRLAFYRFFEVRLEAIWQRLRESDVPNDAIVGVTLATGAPIMPEVILTAGTGNVLGYISLGAEPEAIGEWRFPLFKLTVGKLLQDLGVKSIADPAHLHSLFVKASQGQRVIKQPIYAIPAVADKKQSIQIHHIAGRDDVALIIYDVTPFKDEQTIVAWTDEVAKEIRRIDAMSGRTLKFLRSDIIRSVRSAYRGVERFGLDLPMTLLAAYAPSGQTQSQGTRRSGAQKGSRLQGVCELEILDGGMVAKIGKLHYDRYNALKPVTLEDWVQYFTALGIVHGIEEPELQKFFSAVVAEQRVEGTVIAKGTNPKAASGAYLFPVFSSSMPGTDGTNFRDSQQKRLVRKGDVIAEVRYKNAAIAGTNVYGESVKPPPPPILEVETGDGIDSPDGRKYIAASSGIPTVTTNAIELVSALAFEGDVNLTTGNIYFDGSGEINGSIEAGSIVEVTGDLHVKGMIHAAHVRCGGNLIVDNGIIGDEGAVVHVQGNLSANFIENASVRCQGDVTVKKAIVGSRISCFNLKIEGKGGLLVGGFIECWQLLQVDNLGRDGSDTTLVMGRPLVIVHRIQALEGRAARLVRVLESEKSQAAYVDDKDATRRSKKQQDRLSGMKARIPRLKRIVRALQSRIAALQEKISYNPEACIEVAEILNDRCRIEMCGKAIVTSSSLQSVRILPKKLKGSHISALEDERKEAS